MIPVENKKLSDAQIAFFDAHGIWGAMLSPAARLKRPFAWAGHIPFAMALTKLMQPRLVVELGTHSGNSFCAFCQAVQEAHLPTQCVAVDTWEGDAHAGLYDDSTYRELSAYVDYHYGKFARLCRSTFDEAQTTFEDGTIDVLHIDGLHTYEAVRHDFEYWKPKLSDRSVVLFHDTRVFDRGFGVFILWEELCRIYPAFEFTHSHGLGVLYTGDKTTKIRDFMEIAMENAPAMQQFFERISLAGLPGEAIRYQQRFSSIKNVESETLDCELYLGRKGHFTESFRMIQTLELDGGKGKISFDLDKLKEKPDSLRFDPDHRPVVLSKISALVTDHEGQLHYLTPSKTSAIITMEGDLIMGEDPWIEFELGDLKIKTFEIEVQIQPIAGYLEHLLRHQQHAMAKLNAQLEETNNALNYYQAEIQQHVEAERKLWSDLQVKDSIIDSLKQQKSK